MKGWIVCVLLMGEGASSGVDQLSLRRLRVARPVVACACSALVIASRIKADRSGSDA
jgi:hypothetical protein